MDNDDVVKCLNNLIETSKDGEYGFKTSAEHVSSDSLRQTFEQCAQECRQAAQELQAAVREHGGSAEDGGSATGAMHRGWVAVKGTITGHSDLAMLESCEKGEDTALERYRDALEEDLPPNPRALVERQYEGVKRHHAMIRQLRDQARVVAAR